MGDHFAHRLVVGNHARGRRVDAEADRLAVDLDLVAKLHTLPNVGGLVVDRNTPLQNQLLHLEPRAQPRLRQHLVQLGRLDLGLQHTFGRHKVRPLFFGVETTRNNVFKAVGQRRGFGSGFAGLHINHYVIDS